MSQSFVIGSIILIFLIVCVLFESLIITGFKINRFAPALLHAAVVNMASVAIVYVAWPLISRFDFDEDKVFPLLPLLMLMNIFAEALLLKLLNRKQWWSRIFLTSTVMNLVSFTVLYALLSLL